MPVVRFTQNIQRHVACPEREVDGRTVAEALEAYFEHIPRARGYVVDEQGQLRTHMLVFVNAVQVHDRQTLTDPVDADATIDVMQALSGG